MKRKAVYAAMLVAAACVVSPLQAAYASEAPAAGQGSVAGMPSLDGIDAGAMEGEIGTLDSPSLDARSMQEAFADMQAESLQEGMGEMQAAMEDGEGVNPGTTLTGSLPSMEDSGQMGTQPSTGQASGTQEGSAGSSGFEDFTFPEGFQMETQALEKPSLDAARTEITESMKLNAESTLKDMMGSSFTGLDSDLFNTGLLPDISLESLNVEYAGMMEEFKNNGFGSTEGLEMPEFNGFSGDISEAFQKMFSGMGAQGTSGNGMAVGSIEKIENNVSSGMSMGNSNTSGSGKKSLKKESLEKFRDSDVYKKVNTKLSISNKVEKSKNKKADTKSKSGSKKSKNSKNTKNKKKK